MNSSGEDGRFKELVGCLMYLSRRTRPDIATAVGMLSRSSNSPTAASWMQGKRILRY